MPDFTDEELDELTDQAVAEFGEDGAIERLALASGYQKIPPTLEEFIDDDYFLGKVLGPNSATPLYDFHRDVLKDVFPHPLMARYKEVCYTGPIGAGKSTSCSAGAAYDLCRMLYLVDPHETFHVGFADSIIVAFVNSTRSQAESKQYQQFIAWILASPFFREKLVTIKKNVYGEETPVLPHRITIEPGSRPQMYMGGAVCMALMSELNFGSDIRKDMTFKNFETISTRMDSRFEKGVGGLQAPGRLWLDSSKSDSTGWLEQHIAALKDDTNSLVINEPVWKVVPPWKRKFSDEKFPVFQGNDSMEPRLLNEEDLALFPSADILWVPMDFFAKFNQDIYGGLRDVAGVSTWSSHRYIPQTHLIMKALCLPNLVSKSVVHVDFDNPRDRLIDQIPDVDKIPRGFKYFCHWDIATVGDRAGFAMTRAVGPVPVTKVSADFTSDLATEMAFQTDLVLAVSPVPGKVIPITKMKNLIKDLINLGICIVGVSADGHQSTNLLQDIQGMKIPTKVISTDRDRNAIDLLRDCIVEQRWRGPKHVILENELKDLMDHGDYVDHPKGKSKDISDAVAGSLFNANLKSVASHTPSAVRQHVERKQAVVQEIDPIRAEILRMAGKTLADITPRVPRQTAAERKAKKAEEPVDPIADQLKRAWTDRGREQ